jgi:hypothetical protein
MKHNYIAINDQQDAGIEKIGKRNAYHQAGHAAAIYLINKLKQLPAVHFQIILKPQENDGKQLDRFAGIYSRHTVKVEGGRLIQSLPLSFAEAIQYFTWIQQAEYRCAFEADVINLLAGSLAEAKYVASSDNEVFCANLLNFGALNFYGGSSDFEIITEYMECYLPNKAERDQKMSELFFEAFSFVNDKSNWRAISALVEFIQDEHKSIIHSEDVISLLDSGVTSHKANSSNPHAVGICS